MNILNLSIISNERMDKMKKYLALVFLLTILIIPLSVDALDTSRRSLIDYPRNDADNLDDNTTRNDPLYDNDLDDDNLNDNRDNNGLFNGNDNDNNGSDNGILGIMDDLDGDMEDDDNLVTYIIIGLSGIILGAFGAYLFIKRD